VQILDVAPSGAARRCPFRWAYNRQMVSNTKNCWRIPHRPALSVLERDKNCVYCAVQLLERMPARGSRAKAPTWEHIINDARIITKQNIARCCVSCNASKGMQPLQVWLQSSYCGERGITAESVAPIVKQALRLTGKINSRSR